MIRLADIQEKVSTYAPGADLELIERAYVLSAHCHDGQKRRSGEPYLVHPLAVADILADLKLDVDCIAVGLLHDVIEDTLITYEEVRNQFGEDIANMVDGLSKISKIMFKSREEAQAESFRKMVFAMARDIRVVLVKLADRAHNMRTLHYMPAHKQQRIARETLEIYAPIAHRLGIQTIKIELEDLSFKYLHPDVYRDIEKRLDATRKEREAYMERVRVLLADAMRSSDLDCEVIGRVKNIYSIYRKMVRNSVEFEQIHDLTGFRMLVDTVAQCYQALGQVHSMFRPLDSRFKDYIAVPKSNGYQSLHTTVFGPDNEQIEIQIRTRDMHAVAETGIAAHWRYKEGRLHLNRREIEDVAKLRQLVESAKEVEDPSEFMQSIRSDLTSDEVYVFTPAGAVLAFPEGATPLDFAFAIHTEVGLHCTGAKVDGRIVPFDYRLKSGETVQILTNQSAKPSVSWLNLVVTSRAKTKIRAFLRQEERIRGRELGREILEREFKKHGLNLNRLIKDDAFHQPLQNLHVRNMDELYLNVAYGKVPVDKVLLEFIPKEKLETEKTKGSLVNKLKERLKFKKPSASTTPVRIKGEGDIMVSFARCCNPLHGDPIVGIITLGHGITVHVADCSNALNMEAGRRIEVAWDDKVKPFRNVKIRVVCVDRAGMLVHMSKAIAHDGVNITSAECKAITDKKAINNFEVTVADRETLDKVMASLERVRGVISVERVVS